MLKGWWGEDDEGDDVPTKGKLMIELSSFQLSWHEAWNRNMQKTDFNFGNKKIDFWLRVFTTLKTQK